MRLNTIIMPILPLDERIFHIAKESIRRVRAFSGDDHWLVVIANGGDERYGEMIVDLADKGIYTEERLGYAGAVNVGFDYLHTGTRYVTVGSCDVYVGENWRGHLESDNSLVSGYDMSKPYTKDYGYRGDFWAAWWTQPSQVHETIGKLDEDFNLRFAAQDYAIRAKEAGFEVARANIRFDHVAAKHSSVDSGTASGNFKREIRAEEERFRRKYRGAHNYRSWVVAQRKGKHSE